MANRADCDADCRVHKGQRHDQRQVVPTLWAIRVAQPRSLADEVQRIEFRVLRDRICRRYDMPRLSGGQNFC